MNQICLVVALFGSLVLSEEVVRNPKLFFVSTSATTSTLQTASICYMSSATASATCTGRKRRAITSFSEMETEVQHYKRRLYVTCHRRQHLRLALGEKEEPSPPLVRWKQKFNITNGVYMLHVIGDSICDLHWEKKKS